MKEQMMLNRGDFELSTNSGCSSDEELHEEQESEKIVQNVAKALGIPLDTKDYSSTMIADRLKVWIPFIMYNHDWDWTFIFELLRFKLSSVRDCIEGSAISEPDKKETLKGIDKVIEDINSVLLAEETVVDLTTVEKHIKKFSKHFAKHVQEWWT